jgi:type IV pilus assembly protein PilP
MAKIRPRCFAAALCLWAVSVFFGCDGSDQATQTTKVVKGKVPVVQNADSKPAETAVGARAAQPASSGSSSTETVKRVPASAPVKAAVSGSSTTETGTTEAPGQSGGDPKVPQAVESSETVDDDESTPMEDGLLAAAKLKRLLSLETAFSYSLEGKVDPFKPVLGTDEPESSTERVGQEKKEREKRIPQSPIEMVDLSQLKLTAVILAPGRNLAMVEDATGKGYIVKKGTYIGNREGRVTEILPDRLVVTEQGTDDLGKPMSEAREIQLPKPPGEM